MISTRAGSPAEIGERMRCAALCKREGPSPAGHELVAHPEGEFSIEDVETLVEGRVQMQWRAGEVGFDDLVDHRKPPATTLATQEDFDADLIQ